MEEPGARWVDRHKADAMKSSPHIKTGLETNKGGRTVEHPGAGVGGHKAKHYVALQVDSCGVTEQGRLHRGREQFLLARVCQRGWGDGCGVTEEWHLSLPGWWR